MTDDNIRCRIQYINDLDPFVSTNDRQPLKPIQYTIAVHQPIGEQLPEIIRQLRAPHKVGHLHICIFRTQVVSERRRSAAGLSMRGRRLGLLFGLRPVPLRTAGRTADSSSGSVSSRLCYVPATNLPQLVNCKLQKIMTKFNVSVECARNSRGGCTAQDRRESEGDNPGARLHTISDVPRNRAGWKRNMYRIPEEEWSSERRNATVTN